MKLVVTGGTGTLGQSILRLALGRGHSVVAVSRRTPETLPDGALHRAADVATGRGLAEAIAGADAIIDAANSMEQAGQPVLVDGTRRLLGMLPAAGVGHYIGVSIVGIDTSTAAY